MGRALPRGENADRWSKTFSRCLFSRKPNERHRDAVLAEGCPGADRANAAGAEALRRVLQGADGRERQDTYCAGELLERSQAAHPEQGVHPRLLAPGHDQPGTRPGNLRETDGDGRRIVRRSVEESSKTA